MEIHGWGDGLKLGQVSAVDVNEDDDPVILHRGLVELEVFTVRGTHFSEDPF